jgi:hypothetical protein
LGPVEGVHHKPASLQNPNDSAAHDASERSSRLCGSREGLVPQRSQGS